MLRFSAGRKTELNSSAVGFTPSSKPQLSLKRHLIQEIKWPAVQLNCCAAHGHTVIVHCSWRRCFEESSSTSAECHAPAASPDMTSWWPLRTGQPRPTVTSAPQGIKNCDKISSGTSAGSEGNRVWGGDWEGCATPQEISRYFKQKLYIFCTDETTMASSRILPCAPLISQTADAAISHRTRQNVGVENIRSSQKGRKMLDFHQKRPAYAAGYMPTAFSYSF